MKSFVTLLVLSVSPVDGHSWVECTNDDNTQTLPWMRGNSTLSTPVIIDPDMPEFAKYCHGWARNKLNPGNWLAETKTYTWNVGDKSWDGGVNHPPDYHVCHPNQRAPIYPENAPMATAAPGSSIRLRYGGNGHTRGANVGGNPGIVSVFWKGAPEAEIQYVSELTKHNLLHRQGFADDSFSYPADPNVKTPDAGLVDKGNWMVLNLPADMQPGRHMMVWVWSYGLYGAPWTPKWSTCFDIMIEARLDGSKRAPLAIAKSPTKPPEKIITIEEEVIQEVFPAPAPASPPIQASIPNPTPLIPGQVSPSNPMTLALLPHPKIAIAQPARFLDPTSVLSISPQPSATSIRSESNFIVTTTTFVTLTIPLPKSTSRTSTTSKSTPSEPNTDGLALVEFLDELDDEVIVELSNDSELMDGLDWKWLRRYINVLFSL